MDIYNPPQQVPYLTTKENERIEISVFEIGVWNMNSTPAVNVAHTYGADFENIVFAQAYIRQDAGNFITPLSKFGDSADPLLLQGGITSISSATINLRRRTGGNFDSASYDDAVMNRGFVILGVLNT